jgi:hypothetical protein
MNDRPRSYEKSYLGSAKRQPRDLKLISSGSLIEHSRDIAYNLAKHVGHFVAGSQMGWASFELPKAGERTPNGRKQEAEPTTDFTNPI